MGQPRPLMTSGHLESTVLVNMGAESAGAEAESNIGILLGNRKTPGIAGLLNFNLCMENNVATPFLIPTPMSAWLLSRSVCQYVFCVSVGQRCESMPNSKGHISSPKDKALLYSLRRFYFYFFRGAGRPQGRHPRI